MAEDTTDQAYSQIEELGAQPLWRHYGNLFHAEPRSAAVPYRWSFSDLRPYMLHFTETLSLEEAERRVLMLVNPRARRPARHGEQPLRRDPDHHAGGDRSGAPPHRQRLPFHHRGRVRLHHGQWGGARAYAPGRPAAHPPAGSGTTTSTRRRPDDVARRPGLPADERLRGGLLRAVRRPHPEERGPGRPLQPHVHPRQAEPPRLGDPPAERVLAREQLPVGRDGACARGDRRRH